MSAWRRETFFSQADSSGPVSNKTVRVTSPLVAVCNPKSIYEITHMNGMKIYDHDGQPVRCAADILHSEFRCRIASFPGSETRCGTHGDVAHVPARENSVGSHGRDRVEFIVDDDEDLEGVDFHEGGSCC